MIVKINMKVCPECGRENSDSSMFCTYCGSKLSELLYEPRMNVMDNLKYALNIASSNFKVFYPTLIMIGVMIGLGIVMVLSMGLSFIGYTPESTSNFPWFGGIVFFVLWLIMAYLGIVSIPAFQDVYKSAVLKVEIDFRKSFDYGRSRFKSYLVAIIVIGVVWIIIGAVMIIPFMMKYFDTSFDPTISLEQMRYQMMYQMAPILLVLIPLLAVVYLSTNIMAWDNVEFGPAIKLTLSYLKERWVDLILFLVIGILSSLVGMIPLGFIISYGFFVILNLALIDNYLSYQTTLNKEPH
jgi:hypothetical protein